MVDLLDADEVEIFIDDTGKLWVNVDQQCALRIGHVKKVVSDSPMAYRPD